MTIDEAKTLKDGDWLRVISKPKSGYVALCPEGTHQIQVGDYVQYLEPSTAMEPSVRFHSNRNDSGYDYIHVADVERA